MTMFDVTFEDTGEVRSLPSRPPRDEEFVWIGLGYTEVPVDVDGYVISHAGNGRWYARPKSDD